MNSLLQDVKYGLRSLSRAKGFAAVALLTLALGIGANTGIFSVVYAVLLRPLDFPESDRLVAVWETRRERGIERNVVGAHEFPQWRERSKSFSGLAAYMYSGANFNLTGAGEPVALRGVRVTEDFFDAMGVKPALGRTFFTAENRPGAIRVAVLANRVWKDKFGSDPEIVGRSVKMNDDIYTVVGVMPAGFRFPDGGPNGEPPDVWTPVAEPIHLYRGRHYLFVVGRLKPGVSVEQAQAELDQIGKQLEVEYADASKGHGVNVQPLQAEMVGGVKQALLVLLGIVGLVLMIACANVANLMLARAAARRKEIAIRSVLGGGRKRLARQLLTESMLLAGMGGVLGLVLAEWLVGLLPLLGPGVLPRLDEVKLDPVILLVTAGVTVLTGFLFGLAPMWDATRLNVGDWLKEGGRAGAGRESNRLRKGLVVAEIALALVPLIGAGLLLESLLRLRGEDPGFKASEAMEVDLALPATRYRDPVQQREFYRRLYENFRALPGVQAVGGTSDLPLGGSNSSIPFSIEGQPPAQPGQEVHAQFRVVSRDYFRAMGIPLRGGRGFEESDARVALPLMRWFPQQPVPARSAEPQAAPVALINETMAKRFWPNESPVGKRVRLLSSPWVEVVGIVGDVRHSNLGDAAASEVYLLDLQEPQSAVSVIVRTTGDPNAVASALREEVWKLDSELPVIRMRTMEAVVEQSVDGPRFTTTLVGMFAAIAMGLMLVGIYGLVSYSVAQRVREIGVRLALGAARGDIYRMVIGEGIRLAVIGVALGLGGALVLSRYLRDFLYEVRPVEPVTFAGLALLVLATSVAACLIPARRAMRVEPVEALRYE